MRCGATTIWTKVRYFCSILDCIYGDGTFLDPDDDVIMPAGPPPGAANEEEDSDDDIPMPEGPPPPGQPLPQGLFVSFWFIYFSN
jgi:hypothetical protein